MTVDWRGAAGTATGICIFFGPFAYKDARSSGGSRVRAVLAVGVLFIVLLLWILGASNALYGLGYVIDEPPEILGSGGLDLGTSHFEHVRPWHLLLGLMFMFIGSVFGKIAEWFE